MYKCRKHKLSYMCNLYDVVNAFYLVRHTDLQGFYNKCCHPMGSIILESIVENNIAFVRGSDGKMLMSPASGVGPGLTEATNMFNHVYHTHVLPRYIDLTKHVTNMIQVEVDEGKFVNTSHNVFVDDLMLTFATYDSPTLGSMSVAMSDALDEAFHLSGLVQNRTKKVSLASTSGPQARSCLRSLQQQKHNIL